MRENIIELIESYIKKDELFFDKETLKDKEKTTFFSINFEDFYVQISIQENGEFIQFSSSGYNWDNFFKKLEPEILNKLLGFLMKRNGLKKLCKWGITEEYNIYLYIDFPVEDSKFTYQQYDRIFSLLFSESNDLISKISKEINQKEPKFEF